MQQTLKEKGSYSIMQDVFRPTGKKAASGLIGRVADFIADFYDRNLFERIIIYVFLSSLIVKIVFEVGMGQWSFIQSQNQQWVFYGFFALDFIVSWRKFLNLRVTVNPMSVFALVFFIMCAHGLFVGCLLRNPPFVILNDFVPLFMIGLSILRMQSVAEYKPVDIRYLLTICITIALLTSIFGQAGALAGLPTQPSVGSIAFFPLVLAGLFTIRPFPKWLFITALALTVLNIGDLNRTTLIFIAFVISGYILLATVRNPVQGILVIVIASLLVSAGAMLLPEDSKTYMRLAAISDIDLSERKGSIGERQAEWDAIQAKLASQGRTVEIFGLGFGGLYEVKFTHEWLHDYGHAHYAWAWFNLRFGQSGYFYMVLFFMALFYNGFRAALEGTGEGLFLSLLCLLGVVYCFTHVNSIFLQMGVHFFQPPNGESNRRKTLDDGRSCAEHD